MTKPAWPVLGDGDVKRVADRCLQIFGGYGTRGYLISRFMSMPHSSIYAGTSEVMKMIIALHGPVAGNFLNEAGRSINKGINNSRS